MKRTVLYLILPILVASCAPKKLSGPIDDSGNIPFGLVIPFELGDADYYVIAGTTGEQQETQVDDSTVTGTIWRTYGEYYPSEGVPSDFDVYVNNSRLQPHAESDTLRLRGISDTSLTNGDQVWHFREPGGSDDLVTFVLPTVGLLDTIGPLQHLGGQSGTIRSDTLFTLRWQPGQGGAIRIEWITESGGYVARDAQDFAGSYTFPAVVLANLQGQGRVRVSRYRTITSEFGGRTILAVRISQRSYNVNVQ